MQRSTDHNGLVDRRWRSVSDRGVFLKVMNLSSLTALAVIAGTGALAGAPVMAQAAVPASQVRALNLARNTAVTENAVSYTHLTLPTKA